MCYFLNKVISIGGLLSSIIIILSSSSWFTAWMGLEVNMMTFMPLIVTSNKLSGEAAMKYFFTQVTGSMFLLMFIVLSIFYSAKGGFMMNSLLMSIIILALLLKLGAVPVHFWLPALIEGLSWETTLILITIQKIGPLSLLLMMNMSMKFMLVSSSLMSAVVGSISGLNQLLCRKLMSYSSIAHMGWLLMALSINKMLLWVYFILYCSLTMMVISIFKFYQTFHMSQMLMSYNSIIIVSFTFYLTLLSLGGLPPLMGFLPKWLLLKFMMLSNMFLPAIILVLSSVLTIYFYIRLTYTAFMLILLKSTMNNKINSMNFMMKYWILMPTIMLPSLLMML
uniref:NADH-ubiquinone oxidoreductase chain 2 n=1 Tax=Anaulaciulus koreanus TaxID=1977246 RepID=A0A1W5T104_9MYRI|nr:NADH dehydrogenase subunit 2 [Anaulaciulus koreanus]ARF02889.1 NADH dehydrogenase subunit 2 [Anaulaciulus koreanus]